jgi:tRNA 2-thiouridine synthesizing protein A
MSTPIAVDKEIDARGSHCPGPLMELVRGIKTLADGQTIAVISSDVGSRKDIPLWIEKARHELVAVEDLDANTARFVVRKLAR